MTAHRPLETVPRYLLTKEEAALSLGMSMSTFDRLVYPFIKIVRGAQRVYISPRELERWVSENERYIA
jgi:hypothetical protein